jgi:D-proline reductase (dithiol) PrdB
MRDDPNLAFPIDRMRELAARGRIGSVNRRHLSFMGSITAPGRLISYTAPQAARQLAADAVDAALLIPV